MDDTLYAVHVVLNLSNLPDKPSEGLLNRDDVGKCDTSLRGGNAESGADGQDGHDKGQDDSKKIETDTEPSLVRNRKPVCSVLDVYSFLVILEEPILFAIGADCGKAR